MTHNKFGLIVLAICLLTSMLLVLQHFGTIQLPGCSPESGCAIVAGDWGYLLGWPVSFFGLAYFTGLATAWALIRESGVPMAFRAAVRLGAVASLACLLILWLEQALCIYCLVIQGFHLVFWIVVERSPRAAGSNFTGLQNSPSVRAITAVLAGFALATALLHVALSEQRLRAAERAGREAYRLIEKKNDQEQELSRGASIDDKKAISLAVAGPEVDATVDATVDASNVGDRVGGQQDVSSVDIAGEQATGRPFRLGPDDCEASLVVFFDYQSEACWRIEQEIETLMAEYGDTISVTVRHFPSCTECNTASKSDSHPNACRAAFAAETAGLLKGSDGFWKMHQWLIGQGGEFSDEELKSGLVELGYDDIDEFFTRMNSPAVLGGILADIVEAQTLQIGGTPAVLFNGRLLANLPAGHAIADAVTAVFKDETTAASGQTLDTALDRAAAETFTPEQQLDAAMSTVRIVNSGGRAVGSGVIIAVGDSFVHVLTAHHIVPGAKRVEVQTFSRQSYPKPAGIYSWATVIATSEPADLAVIRFSTRDPRPVPMQIVPLERLPPDSVFPALTIGCDGQDLGPTCLANQVLDKKQVRRTAEAIATTVWEMAGESAAGRSGGPLVDRSGFVLGIASGISDGKGYFCHAEEIHRFLAQNGLQALAAPRQTEKNQ